jgi:hypothetical protein
MSIVQSEQTRIAQRVTASWIQQISEGLSEVMISTQSEENSRMMKPVEDNENLFKLLKPRVLQIICDNLEHYSNNYEIDRKQHEISIPRIFSENFRDFD